MTTMPVVELAIRNGGVSQLAIVKCRRIKTPLVLGILSKEFLAVLWPDKGELHLTFAGESG